MPASERFDAGPDGSETGRQNSSRSASVVDDDRDDSPAASASGAKATRSKRKRREEADDDNTPASEAGKKPDPNSRKEQNRISQEKSRNKKAGYVAHMESQVSLLRLNKDAQGEALMRTIDVLLRENTRLRLIIGTMSSLLGNGSAGALADMGVSRQELHEAVTVGDKARLSLVAKDISDAATQVHRARRDKPDPPVASYMETEKHHQSFWDALHETFATLKKPQPQKQEQEQEQEKPRTASGSGPPTTNGPVGMSSASAPSMHDPVLESVSTAGPPPQHGAPFQFSAFAPMAGPSTHPPKMATAMPGAPYTLDTHIPASSGTAFLGLDTDSLNTTPSSTDLNNAFTPSDLFAGLCMPDVFPAPAHSQAGQLEAQAFELVKAHVSQRMLDPAYSMPAALQPTTMQSSLPHDPAIDSVLWPSMRDKLIASDVQARLAQGIGQVLNAKTVLQDLQSMTTIHPTWDLLDPQAWEVHGEFVHKYPSLVDAAILQTSNRWRAMRGDPPLVV